MSNPILKYQNEPALTLENAGHGYRYYGVNREPNLKAIKEIEAYMNELYSDFYKFCNFKTNKDGTKSIRFLAHYSSSFIGIAYLRVDEIGQSITQG